MFSRIKSAIRVCLNSPYEPDCLDFLDSLYQNDSNSENNIALEGKN